VKSQKEKMLSGELYLADDPELTAARKRARQLCRAFNTFPETGTDDRPAILNELFGYPTDVVLEPPFHCDYGFNIHLGRKVFFNFNCVILDVMKVTIGDHVFCGPGVQIYTATHPLDAAERRTGLEFARPIEIGSDVWIGGGAIICPGVQIGSRSVIGAGSVVTRNIPEDVVAAGNPCRVLRKLV
jgi:maltose O-acetyltransferase